jgi:hypothetical protein
VPFSDEPDRSALTQKIEATKWIFQQSAQQVPNRVGGAKGSLGIRARRNGVENEESLSLSILLHFFHFLVLLLSEPPAIIANKQSSSIINHQTVKVLRTA